MTGMEIDGGPLPPSSRPETADSEKGNETILEPVEVANPNQDGDNELQRTTTNASSVVLASKARTISLVITLTGAAFLNTLSVQAAVIVLPTIGDDLGIPAARQQWIVSAYSLTFGCFLSLWGRLADVYGKRSIFIWGSAWVAACTIAIPFCPDEISFDVLRGSQGSGAAANVPTAIGILGVTFPPGKAKNYAFSFYSAGAPMGSVFGNILGGVVGQYASWKWIFWISAIIAAVVTASGYFIIPQPPVHAHASALKGAVDWFGGTVITVASLMSLFALTEGNVVGWRTAWVPVLIVVSVSSVGVFAFWQHFLEKKGGRPPLMKVSVFKSVKVSAAMVAMALFFASFNNYSVFATYFFQEYQGQTAIETTSRFIPTGVVGCMTVIVTSQILARVRVHYILMFGMLVISISNLLFAIPIPSTTTYWAFGFPAMVLSVFGADTLYPSLTSFTAHSLPRSDQALGGALINAVGQIGRAIGLAIGTAIQVAVQASAEGTSVQDAQAGESRGNPAYLKGVRAAEWLNFAFGITGFVVVAFFFRGPLKVGAHKK